MKVSAVELIIKILAVLILAVVLVIIVSLPIYVYSAKLDDSKSVNKTSVSVKTSSNVEFTSYID